MIRTHSAIHDALPIVLQASHQWALLVMQTMTPYIFIGAARMIAYIIADQVFPRGVLMQQQDIRTRTSDSGAM